MGNEAKNTIVLDQGITRKEINSLTSTLSLAQDCDVTLPQANSVNRLFNILVSLKDGAVTPNEIAMSQEFTPRQAVSYLDALKYLNLAHKLRPGVFELTEKGKEIVDSKPKDACIFLAKEILGHYVFMRTFRLCLQNESIPKTAAVIELMRKCNIKNGSVATERRRAACVRDWIIWIVSLPFDMPIE